MNKIFDVGQYVCVPDKNITGQIIDVVVNKNNDTVYIVQFYKDTYDYFLGKDLDKIN